MRGRGGGHCGFGVAAEGEVSGAVAFDGRRAGRAPWLPAGVWLLVGRRRCGELLSWAITRRVRVVRAAVVDGEVGRGHDDVRRAGGGWDGWWCWCQVSWKNAVQSFSLGGMVLSCSPLLGSGRRETLSFMCTKPQLTINRTQK